MNLINQERANWTRWDAKPLSWDSGLAAKAREWAKTMVETGEYEHSGGAEIIWVGSVEPSRAVQVWMASNDGHGGAIVSERAKSVGVGYAERNGVGYWVAQFR